MALIEWVGDPWNSGANREKWHQNDYFVLWKRGADRFIIHGDTTRIYNLCGNVVAAAAVARKVVNGATAQGRSLPAFLSLLIGRASLATMALHI